MHVKKVFLRENKGATFPLFLLRCSLNMAEKIVKIKFLIAIGFETNITSINLRVYVLLKKEKRIFICSLGY